MSWGGGQWGQRLGGYVTNAEIHKRTTVYEHAHIQFFSYDERFLVEVGYPLLRRRDEWDITEETRRKWREVWNGGIGLKVSASRLSADLLAPHDVSSGSPEGLDALVRLRSHRSVEEALVMLPVSTRRGPVVLVVLDRGATVARVWVPLGSRCRKKCATVAKRRWWRRSHCHGDSDRGGTHFSRSSLHATATSWLAGFASPGGGVAPFELVIAMITVDIALRGWKTLVSWLLKGFGSICFVATFGWFVRVHYWPVGSCKSKNASLWMKFNLRPLSVPILCKFYVFICFPHCPGNMQRDLARLNTHFWGKHEAKTRRVNELLQFIDDHSEFLNFTKICLCLCNKAI